jgi:hypothetical protein
MLIRKETRQDVGDAFTRDALNTIPFTATDFNGGKEVMSLGSRAGILEVK